MARSGVRIQVLLPTPLADQVELVSQHEDISLSKVICRAMEQHASTDEWQARLAGANRRREAVIASIADLPPEKQQLLALCLQPGSLDRKALREQQVVRGRASLHPSRESRGDVEGPSRLGLESRPAPRENSQVVGL